MSGVFCVENLCVNSAEGLTLPSEGGSPSGGGRGVSGGKRPDLGAYFPQDFAFFMSNKRLTLQYEPFVLL
ncbi:MAG: hypothetical protein A2945_02775 [Candidatus Liptonbacteria bacterium RIFCSPLOWO2_01_FULL_52_25]|uniref:Uncharacterized protein n=1 Tax=Candidatus Liptonbacteria bacterium RIFCSPLOWO2_01_FULL_52_25 TaxID=1798650 RepID=A0A1G2CE77_9BACT|nr:MAG: hypothetical protein A2945_02775 [Candidatus Liptonbacteria bacterium RIFCSPLOWO2_01_FULL_52_25]